MLTIEQIQEKLNKEIEKQLENEEEYKATLEEGGTLQDYIEDSLCNYEGLELIEYSVLKDKDSEFEHVVTDNLGDGNEMWFVMRYKPTGQTVGYTGYYSSWDSSEWEDMTLKFMKVTSTMEIWGEA